MNISKLSVVALGTAAVVVAGTGVTYAAGAAPFVLGHANRAKATSTLSNSGKGPALSLKTRSAKTPPLAVSNSTKIAKLNADELDGLSSGSFQRRVSGHCSAGKAVSAIASSGSVTCVGAVNYNHVYVVKAGTDSSTNGTALRNAVSSAGAAATNSSPALVYAEPGTYDLGANALLMPAWVDLDGAGPDLTTLTAHSDSANLVTALAPDTSVVRHLTVNASGPDIVVAVDVEDACAGLDDVMAVAEDGSSTAAVWLGDAAACLNAHDVTTAGDFGLLTEQSGAQATFIDSALIGDTDAAFLAAGSGLQVAASEVAGGVAGTGTAFCVASWDAAYSAVGTNCN